MVYKDIDRDAAQTSDHVAHMAAVILRRCRTPVEKGREKHSGKQLDNRPTKAIPPMAKNFEIFTQRILSPMLESYYYTVFTQ